MSIFRSLRMYVRTGVYVCMQMWVQAHLHICAPELRIVDTSECLSTPGDISCILWYRVTNKGLWISEHFTTEVVYMIAHHSRDLNYLLKNIYWFLASSLYQKLGCNAHSTSWNSYLTMLKWQEPEIRYVTSLGENLLLIC